MPEPQLRVKRERGALDVKAVAGPQLAHEAQDKPAHKPAAAQRLGEAEEVGEAGSRQIDAAGMSRRS